MEKLSKSCKCCGKILESQNNNLLIQFCVSQILNHKHCFSINDREMLFLALVLINYIYDWQCTWTTGILSFCPILLAPPITVYFIVQTSCFIVTRSKEMYLLIRGCAEKGFLFEDLEEKNKCSYNFRGRKKSRFFWGQAKTLFC